jgi:molybdopterin-containing oxidoreductase family membrane subunit
MRGILAHYDPVGATLEAIERLRAAGHTELEIFSPIPAPELEEAMDIHSSPVGLWSLIGGITGFTTAVLLTAGTSLAYPLVTQGKPIVSIPPFIVVMFELTVLLTGIFALFAMLAHARRPTLRLSPNYRKAFSVDRWGVFVPVPDDRRRETEDLVRETSPVEVEVQA